MNKISKFIILFLTACSLFAQSTHSQETPRAIPAAQIEKISSLLGNWQLTTEIFNPENTEWREVGQNIVSFDLIMNGMGLRETPVEHISGDALGVETTFSYDQYREVFRLSVLDDTWGIMDIYEGQVEGDKLTATNIGKGTHFPTQDGDVMEFRLNMTLVGGTRVTDINLTTDSGKTWNQFYRLTYIKQ